MNFVDDATTEIGCHFDFYVYVIYTHAHTLHTHTRVRTHVDNQLQVCNARPGPRTADLQYI